MAVTTRSLERPSFLLVPPLEQGDRLTRGEFERRYVAMRHLKKAELVEGIVYMPSPVHHQAHSRPHAMLMTCLGVYCAATPGVDVGDNATVRLDADNEVQPDAFLRLQRGASRISRDDTIEGSPELIIEIAGSSASYDLHDKLKVYRRNKVQEYLVWRVYDQQIDWFELQADEYRLLLADEQGVVRSHAFPGLWLSLIDLVAGDWAAIMLHVQRGLQAQEHAEFVQRLQVAP
jgi:Uma2 family endonuclease